MFVSLSLFSSCDDFLDREPLDEISSTQYFSSADDLAAYTINYYSFPTHAGWNLGTLNNDNGTDNQVSGSANQNLYVEGKWLVPSKAGSWLSITFLKMCYPNMKQEKSAEMQY